MARFIIRAAFENEEWASKAREPLSIDDWLSVHWKNEIVVEDWTGEVTFSEASFHITRFGGDPKNGVDTYGRIDNSADQNTVRKSLSGANANRHIARVHRLEDPVDYGLIRGFYIELLTGDDAYQINLVKKIRAISKFLRDHMMLCVIVAVIIWWLLS